MTTPSHHGAKRGCRSPRGRLTLVTLACALATTVWLLAAGPARAATPAQSAQPRPNSAAARDAGTCGGIPLAGPHCPAHVHAAAGAGATGATTAPASSGWSVVPTPNTDANHYNGLYSVACASPTECWGVDSYDTGSVYQTLIERWDGSAWSIVPSPNTSPSQSNGLLGVTCVSVSDCWAVGAYYINDVAGGSTVEPVVMRWDGTSWAIVASPNGGGPMQSGLLQSVSCTSVSNCWAVGYDVTSVSAVVTQVTAESTLIEHWDGAAWTIVSSPSVNAQYSVLKAVACVSSDCWAVGGSSTSSGDVPLIEHWEGSSWTIVPPAAQSTVQAILYGVACTSTTDCWTDGFYASSNAYADYQTLIEHWDGTSWTLVASPNTSSTQYNYLTDITCATASECWAVGAYSNGTNNQTVIELWDGRSWTMVTAPDSNTTQDNILFSVACASASECWAVGHYGGFNTGMFQTLAEEYVGAPTAQVPETRWTPLLLFIGMLSLATPRLVRRVRR